METKQNRVWARCETIISELKNDNVNSRAINYLINSCNNVEILQQIALKLLAMLDKTDSNLEFTLKFITNQLRDMNVRRYSIVPSLITDTLAECIDVSATLDNVIITYKYEINSLKEAVIFAFFRSDMPTNIAARTNVTNRLHKRLNDKDLPDKKFLTIDEEMDIIILYKTKETYEEDDKAINAMVENYITENNISEKKFFRISGFFPIGEKIIETDKTIYDVWNHGEKKFLEDLNSQASSF